MSENANGKRVYEVEPIALRMGAKRMKPAQSRWNRFTCPICGEQRGHLYIHSATQAFKCFNCGAKGRGGVKFYMLAGGINDWDLALREVKDGRLGPNVCVELKDMPLARDLAAPLEYRDKVYRAFLNLLPLYPVHLNNLRQRGLPFSMIYQRYRSVPRDARERWRICRLLLRDGYNLENVPGFYARESKESKRYWDFVYYGSGFFIPACSAGGLVQGLKVRLDDEDKKRRYLTFSSIGLPGGASPGGMIHVAVPTCGIDTNVKRCWITEGELKADIAANILGRIVISVPGVNCWSEVRGVLHELGAREVVIAYDADQYDKKDVLNAKIDLIADLSGDPSFILFDTRWNIGIGKGIDNALVFIKKNRDVDEMEFISGKIAIPFMYEAAIKIRSFREVAVLIA